jgi:hypothetical protein
LPGPQDLVDLPLMSDAFEFHSDAAPETCLSTTSLELHFPSARRPLADKSLDLSGDATPILEAIRIADCIEMSDHVAGQKQCSITLPIEQAPRVVTGLIGKRHAHNILRNTSADQNLRF